jgi:hypothetical protein
MDIWYVIASILGIIWTLPFILTRIVGLQLYRIVTWHVADNMLKTLEPEIIISSFNMHDANTGKPQKYGFFITRACAGYANKDPTDNCRLTFYILARPSYYDELYKNSQNKYGTVNLSDTIPIQIKIYDRALNQDGAKYTYNTIPISIKARENQISIINAITALYEKQNTCICFINGSIGIGKSMIGLLLAQHYKSMLCTENNPTDPGDGVANCISGIYTKEKNMPRILVWNEVDIMIEKIHVGIPCKKIPFPSVYDKRTWNNLLDDFKWKAIYTILVMTSNKSREDIAKIDSSYLREGRVDLYFQMTSTIPTQFE